jgi:hypothetical protein
MPGSTTTPGSPSARVDASGHVAFRYTESAAPGTGFLSRLNGWPARPRRFADALANACARLGADVDRYFFIFIAEDLHLLLLAGLPAHPCKNSTTDSL